MYAIFEKDVQQTDIATADQLCGTRFSLNNDYTLGAAQSAGWYDSVVQIRLPSGWVSVSR
jgi:hypothetical protein